MINTGKLHIYKEMEPGEGSISHLQAANSGFAMQTPENQFRAGHLPPVFHTSSHQMVWEV